MSCGPLKLVMSLIVPIAASLLYAKQIQLEDDIRAMEWNVQHPPTLQWVMDHPRESLKRDQAEARYLHQLLLMD
jgi:hypothetical protein